MKIKKLILSLALCVATPGTHAETYVVPRNDGETTIAFNCFKSSNGNYRLRVYSVPKNRIRRGRNI